MTFALFLLVACVISWGWNRLFDPVPLRIVVLFYAIVCLYEASTLFTSRVDIPSGISAAVYPWKADSHPRADSNTGIIPTQIVPWTRVARDAIRSGEWPLWNRYSAAGSPLLANQQTAIFHPFTLAGLFFLSIGKAFTLSVCLRLFTLVFFTFTFLRGLPVRTGPAVFGSIAYTFCTFHIVWLLFPLGLATMMLPVALSGVQQVFARGRFRSFVLLAAGLGASVLGGHPESAFWVWAVAAGYAAWSAFRAPSRVWIAAVAFLAAASSTAFVWMPTVSLLRVLSRASIMSSRELNPANHHLGPEWLQVLVAPNLLGTVQSGTWRGPSSHHLPVLDDYGEMASGYAGLITLAFAAYALIHVRRREIWFFGAVALFSLLTISEAPLWRDVIRFIPIVGLTLHQRLRIVWVLGIVGLATLTVDSIPRRTSIRIVMALSWLAVLTLYIVERPTAPAAWISLCFASASVLVVAAFPERAAVAALATFVELFTVTYGYNPSSAPGDVFPRTGAIALLTREGRGGRMLALGWSFLPDTPAYYGIEDVKSTDPVSNSPYKRLFHGFLHIGQSYDEVVGDISEPFLDFLNIRRLYVPPDAGHPDARFVLQYAGPDGAIYDNPRALPRYFIPRRFSIRGDVEAAIPRLKQIRDFRESATVDHVPERVARTGLLSMGPDDWRPSAPGTIDIDEYANNFTRLRVSTAGWSLLASSDANWPGWRAYVDGVRVPPVTVNGAFVGTFVPPGAHTVEFRYRPASFDVGLRVSGACDLLIIAVAFARARRFRSGKRQRLDARPRGG